MASMAATHAQGKELKDVIFGASAAAQAAIQEFGAHRVTNATLGAIFDDAGNLACLQAVEKAFRALKMTDIAAYAPIAGLPAYREKVMGRVFGDHRPEGYVDAIATAGGTGAVHHAIENYSEIGDAVLTSDWHWGPYGALCANIGRHLETFRLFDDQLAFDKEDFARKARELLKTQDSLLIILNTPAHNPTGYSLSSEDWDAVLTVCREAAPKKIALLADIAYIDYAGDDARAFMEKFNHLPANMFVLFAFSMSKAYTLYGQRAGAIVGLSPDKEAIEEFTRIMKYSSRATWSNVNRAAMTVLVQLESDAELLQAFEAERASLYQTIQRRGAIFMEEATAVGLKALPYKAGFFLSIPAQNPQALADALHEEQVFAVPLGMGLRIAVCGVPTVQMKGLAAKVKHATQAINA